MKNPDLFESAKRQLKRGKRDTERLQKRFLTYIKRVRHTQRTEVNADGTEKLLKVHFDKRIPEKDWADIAYTAVDALRSALDQAGYAAAVAAGKIEPKQAYFPVADDPAGLDNAIKGRCRDLPQEVVTVFRSFKPYKGGNDLLWSLNKLRHAFHTRIAPVNLAAGGAFAESIQVSGEVKIGAPTFDAEKNDVIVARIGHGGYINYKGSVSLAITFDKVEPLRNVPIPAALFLMGEQVNLVIKATESKCRELGLIK